MADGEIGCTRVEALLSGYLDRELGGQERAFVEAHLATCANCRARLEQYRHLDTSLRRLRDQAAPAMIAPLVMRELGVTRGEGGRITSGDHTIAKAGAAPPTPVIWVMRAGFGVLTLAAIAILSLFVMARIRQLPQAPLPVATINTITFDNTDMVFHLNATSEQGIRDIALAYWYDPYDKMTQSFHYERAQAEIEMDYRTLNFNAKGAPDAGRAIFYQWTIIENSGRTTELPLQYIVYSGRRVAYPWQAITTTHTMIYFAGAAPDQIRHEFAPVVEAVYSDVTGEIGITPNLIPSFYIFQSGANESSDAGPDHPVATYRGEDRGLALARIDLNLTPQPSPSSLKAGIARSLTELVLDETLLMARRDQDREVSSLQRGLPEYMSRRYLPPSPMDQVLLNTIARVPTSSFGNQNYVVPFGNIDDVRSAAFIRYLVDTHGKDKLHLLLLLLKDSSISSDRAWSLVYGNINPYSEAWNHLVDRNLAEQANRISTPPAIDLEKQGGDVVWTRNIALSQFRQLTQPPIWSPDSTRLLYSRGVPSFPIPSMYVYDLNSTAGKEQWVSSDYMFSDSYGWSPDGKYIIFTRPMNYDAEPYTRLFIQPIGAFRPITLTAGYDVRNAVWLADGSIVLSRQESGGNYHLYTIDKQTLAQVIASTRPLTGSVAMQPLLAQDAIPGDTVVLAASRDGKRLAVQSRTGITAALYLVEGGEARHMQIPDTMPVDTVDFSPDGKRLVFTSPNAEGRMGIFVYNIDNATLTGIATPLTASGIDLWPAWLDDDWIVFCSTRAGGYDLYATKAGSDRVLRLTGGTGFYLRPVPSPDGKHLSFLKLEDLRLTLLEVGINANMLDSPP